MLTRPHQLPEALAGASPKPYWLDQAYAPTPMPPLDRTEHADLAVIGGGFSGLWTALLAKERDPERNVVLVEGRRIAWAGTGRNGGFCSASLTHGLGNGLERFPAEMPLLGGWARRTCGRSARRSPPAASTVTSRPPGSCTSRRHPGSSRACPSGRKPPGRSATTPKCSTRPRCGGSWTHRCSSAGCVTPTATRWWAGAAGLGVGATRFGAQVMLDMLEKSDTERRRLA